MILPSTTVAAGPATATSDAPAPTSTSWVPPYGSEQWNSFIGIITAIVGNVLISFALNTQRYAHIRLEREWQAKERQRKRRSASYRSLNGGKPYRDEEPRAEEDAASEDDPLLPATPSPRSTGGSRPGLSPVQEEGDGDGEEAAYKQKSYLKSPYWWAGIIMMTCGEAGNFLAYGFAPASIVSPLGVVALISNCIIAPFMLKEPFRTRDALGVLVAVGGAVTVVLSASDNNPKLGPDDIWSLISTWEFETYFGITAAVIVALVSASNKYGDKNILIDLGLVGLFGGYTALSTKGVASMLSYTLWHAITFPVTYLLVAILVGTAIMQIKYINRALQRFDATQVIPVQFVLFTLSVILGSAVLYRDFERTSGEDAGKFIGGCAMTFLGVWLITSGRPKRSPDDDDDNDDDEEERDPEPNDAINLNLSNGEPYRDSPSFDGNNDATPSLARPTSPPPESTNLPTEPSNLTTPNPTPSLPSPLTANPWDNPPPLTTTLSTPILPSHSPDPHPPRPQTPIRQTSDTAAIAPTPPSTLNHRLRRIATSERVPSRNSVGPLLASPLAGLGAVVADLKRGQGLGGRRGSVMGGEMGGGEVLFGGELLERERDAGGEEGRVGRGRGRSLSGTLGELWRGWRGGADLEAGAEDVARGGDEQGSAGEER